MTHAVPVEAAVTAAFLALVADTVVETRRGLYQDEYMNKAAAFATEKSGGEMRIEIDWM